MNIMRGIRVRVSCQFKLAAGGGNTVYSNTGSCSTAQWSPLVTTGPAGGAALYSVQATVYLLSTSVTMDIQNMERSWSHRSSQTCF